MGLTNPAEVIRIGLLIHSKPLAKYLFSHFRHMDDFYEDVAKGRLAEGIEGDGVATVGKVSRTSSGR